MALSASRSAGGDYLLDAAFFSVNASQSGVAAAPYRDGISVSATDIATDFGVLPSVIRVVAIVDTSLFRPLPQIRRDQQIVATASADAPLKGLHVLLRAFKQLCGERPEQKVVLIARPKPGGDTGFDKSARFADRIRFVGDASHEDINRIYAESALALCALTCEGFGLPAVEALAAGIPLVSSDGGALKEVVSDGGLQVSAGDHAALAEASREWMTPHWRRSLSVACNVYVNIFAGQSARGRWFISTGAVLTHANGRS